MGFKLGAKSSESFFFSASVRKGLAVLSSRVFLFDWITSGSDRRRFWVFLVAIFFSGDASLLFSAALFFSFSFSSRDAFCLREAARAFSFSLFCSFFSFFACWN